ncbi:hypothetical protein K456DRAFT_1743320 [Colletotrichum gloeosporioides 23]|nr:hypothetical protein K456DRAFT_1743320 [Colletotrichum gloeosporioides 23]
MVDFGVNPEAVYPYQLPCHGDNADADYLIILAQWAKHTPNVLRKVSKIINDPFGSLADFLEWLNPPESTSFFSRMWSSICMTTKRVITCLISNPWLIVAIIVLIVVVWMLYRLRQSQATREPLALDQSSCPVCNLLAQVLPEGLNGKNCRLVALSSSAAILDRDVRKADITERSDCTVLFPMLKAKFADESAWRDIKQTWYDAGCLAIVKAGGKNHLPTTGPRQISPEVDFGLIKDWLKHCTTKHHDTCKSVVGGSSGVRELRVIDCQSKTIVDAPASCKYFALSYVWGSCNSQARRQSSGEKENGGFTKANIDSPQVVVDAICVTVKLGGRYLWVDQLCIDQNDGRAKSAQIAQMYEIYSHAHLTLVAADGENSSCGLPGVATRQRRPQRQLSVDDGAIIQIFPHTSAEIRSSIWAERGWTYQEGYLSSRRLIFTERQVSYLCNTMHCMETIKMPLDLPEKDKKANISSFVDMIPSPPSSSETSKDKHWQQLKQTQLVNYTKRKLTEDSDSLNAVLGLFRALQTNGIRHLYGIPVREPPRSSASGFEFSLAWHHEAVSLQRRAEFPSWTWSGWEGGIRMTAPDISDAYDCEIQLVQENGHVVLLQDWLYKEMRNPNLPSTKAPRMLRITAKTVPVDLQEKSWNNLNEGRSSKSCLANMSFNNGIHAVLPICKNVTAMVYANMDEDISLDAELLGLLFQPKHQQSGGIQRHTILLLRQNGQYYQRVGLVRVPGLYKTRPAATADFDSQMICIDSEGIPLGPDEFKKNNRVPLWLQGAMTETITIL